LTFSDDVTEVMPWTMLADVQDHHFDGLLKSAGATALAEQRSMWLKAFIIMLMF